MNNITMGMTSQEKQVYFNHLEKRTSEEQERVNAQRKRVAIYRESLIAEILNCNSNFTKEQLNGMRLSSLEMIACC